MKINKKIIIIFATVVALSWFGNIAFYFTRKIEGPVFSYSYIDSYKSTIELSYLVNQYDKDRVVSIVLPELNDAEFYNTYSSSNFGNMFFMESNQTEDIYEDGSAHYNLVSFTIDLSSGRYPSGEEYKFDDIYAKGVNITKIKYSMESGKVGECNIGNINIAKIEEEKEYRGYDLVENDGGFVGGSDGYTSRYESNYLAKDDIEIVGFKGYLDNSIFSEQEVLVDGEVVHENSFPIKIKKGDHVFLEHRYSKIPFYLNCDLRGEFIIRDPEGTEDIMICGSVFTAQHTKNVTIKEVDKLLEMRGLK